MLKCNCKNKGGKKMNTEQFNDLMFYCWQLNIKTLYQLQQIKQQYNVKSNKDLLDLLCKLYNSDYYFTIKN